ncbi:Uncharacterised protein [Vibrio cholerae]|nr:Uncharacterised protein [Vibrio cholerae]
MRQQAKLGKVVIHRKRANFCRRFAIQCRQHNRNQTAHNPRIGIRAEKPLLTLLLCH